METRIPRSAETTAKSAEAIVTLRKVRKIRMAESAGKMTSAEIRREPTRFIARTIITATMTEIKRL